MRRLVLSVSMLGGLCGSGIAAAQSPPATSAAMVFFDYGKFEIQRDYQATLDGMATILLGQPGATAIVEGHSDRPGSASSNRLASLRRAEAVRDHLVAKGVPARAITVHAHGEERPLIVTADGVREPQNRRVDVRLVTGPAR